MSSTINRHRWFALACLFLLVNSWGVWHLVHRADPNGTPNTGDTPRLLQTAPSPEQPLADRHPLTFNFSSDMVLSGDASASTNTVPAELLPHLRGTWEWTSPRQATFTPTADWPVGVAIQARSVDGLADASRTPLAPFLEHWSTPALRVEHIRQTALSANAEATLEIAFNAPPNRDHILDHLTLRGPDDAVIKYRLGGRSHERTLLLTTRPLETDTLTVHIDKAVKPRSGSRSMEKDHEETLTLSAKLRFGRFQLKETDTLVVSANLPVDPTLVPKFLTIVPSIDVAVEPDSSSASRFKIKGEFKPGKAYKITLTKGLPSTLGSTLLQDITWRTVIPDRDPSLDFADDGVYLSSRGNRQITLEAVNLAKGSITAAHVLPQNLHQFIMRREGRARTYGYDAYKLAVAGKKHPLTFPVSLNETQRQSIALDTLGAAEATGAWIVSIDSEHTYHRDRLVVVSDIGLHARQTGDALYLWAQSLRTVEPLDAVEILVYNEYNQRIATAQTDAAGFARMELPEGDETQTPFLLVAHRGTDATFLPLTDTINRQWTNRGTSPLAGGHYEAFLFSERDIYRPGEPGMTKVVVRDRDGKAPPPHPIEIRVIDKEDRSIHKATTLLNENGTAVFEWTWEKWLPTGTYRIEARVPGAPRRLGNHAIKLEEFVPPTLVAKITRSRDRGTLDEPVAFTINARHLFGAPAAHQPLEAQYRFLSVPFTHPDWEGYRFVDQEQKDYYGKRERLTRLKLDAEGNYLLQPQLEEGIKANSALQVQVSATVIEPSGRTVPAFRSAFIDPFPWYVGLRVPENKLRAKGHPVAVDLARVRPDGVVVTGPDHLQVVVDRVTWVNLLRREHSAFRRVRERKLDRVAEASIACDGKATWSFTPDQAGLYRIRVVDPKSGHAATHDVPVSYSMALAESERDARQSPHKISIELVDESPLTPGATARVAIDAPFVGEGILSLETDGILTHSRFSLTNQQQEVSVPLDPSWNRPVTLTALLFRPVEVGVQHSVYRASGGCVLPIERANTALDVHITAPESTRPASPLQASVQVMQNGKPAANADVFVGIVDEGILGLTRYDTPDPRAWFHRPRRHTVRWTDFYEDLLPERDSNNDLEVMRSETGGGFGALSRDRLNPINARRFKSTALWVGSTLTDSNGVARISVDLPEFSGAVRLTAVAVHHAAYGGAKQTVKVRRPVVVSASLPRFLAPEDEARCPVWLHNTTDQEQTIALSLKTDGPLACTPTTANLTVPPQARIPWTFTAKASQAAGKATWKMTVTSTDDSYTETIEIAVRPPFALSHQHRTAVLQPGASQRIEARGDWLPGTEKSRAVASGLPALAFAQNLSELVRYPYGCAEQTASGLLPLLYLTDLAEAIAPGTIPPGTTDMYIDAGILRLRAMQTYSGGFSWWPGNDRADPFCSLYAGWTLLEAREAGFEIEASVVDGIREFAREITRGYELRDAGDHELTLQAFAAAVLARSGSPDLPTLTYLRGQTDKLTVTGRAFTAMGLSLAGYRPAAAELLAPVSTQQLKQVPRENTHVFTSPRRDTALLLGAWLLTQPDHPSVPALLQTLKDQPVRTYSTQENGWLWWSLGLLSNQNPPGAVAMELTQGGQSTESTKTLSVDLTQGAATIRNTGKRPVYLYIEESGVPLTNAPPAEDSGLQVRRRLLDHAGKPVDPKAIAAGQIVVVEIEVKHVGDLDHLVIDELLPAGLEIEQPHLAANSPLVEPTQAHQLPVVSFDARDDRLLIFPGPFRRTGVYRYLTRAVTPGTYRLPPIQAEAMYDPTRKSRTTSSTITVVPE